LSPMRAVEAVDDILASGGDVEVEELIQTDDLDLATLGEVQLYADDPGPGAALGVAVVLVLNAPNQTGLPLERTPLKARAPRPASKGRRRAAGPTW